MNRNSRRDFLRGSLALASLGLLPGCGLVPPVGPKPKRAAKVGILAWTRVPDLGAAAVPSSFPEGLRDLGYDQGDIHIELPAVYEPERFGAVARELARLDPDVIVAETTPAILAARQAAPTLPIVMVDCGDPVGSGLVASLARPGGNVTGLSSVSPQLSGKRLELLKEAFPRISRVAVMRNPDNQDSSLDFAATEDAARALGLRLQPLEVRSPGDFRPALESARAGQSEGLVILSDTHIFANRADIVAFGLTQQLPTMFDRKEFAAAGGLMSYGPDMLDHWRLAARYVGRILRGAKPADLPIEQPTRFEFVLNLQTAQRIGWTIPASVRLPVTEFVE